MICCRHSHYEPTEGGDRAFEVQSTHVRYGRGVLSEVGDAALELGMRRVALFTDKHLAALPFVATVRDSLRRAKVDVVEFDDVHIEPTDASFKEAAAFAAEGTFDGYVSVGGGSVIDTCKAANLYATHPADFMDYVNAPLGAGRPVPGPLKPHIACPTTSGTGSECTGITICDLLSMRVKTGIASRHLKPTQAIVDPDVTRTLPAQVVACSGFDVLSHALESYTALPYTRRPRPAAGARRPLSQGANPYSDVACLEALRITGRNIVRAVADPEDDEAREQMMFAATLAGIGFGNSGVHVPHGMAYAVAGLVRDVHPAGYPPDEPLIPHGMSVIVNGPAVFEFTAAACPERHLFAAQQLGADAKDASLDDAGEVLCARLIELMRATGMPNGLSALRYTREDVGALVEGAFPQQRLLKNAPLDVSRGDLERLYARALTYW